MPRKVALTPLQGSLLQMLGEAGEEELQCIRATLQVQDEAALQAAIKGLKTLEYIRAGSWLSSDLPSLVLTDKGRVALRT